MIQGRIPRRPFAVQKRMQKPRLKAKRLAERRALRAQPSEIRRMLLVAFDRRAAETVRRRRQAAANAAIRTNGLDCARNHARHFVHAASLKAMARPKASSSRKEAIFVLERIRS